MPTSLPPTFSQTKVLVQQDNTKDLGREVRWTPMGREGSVLQELTKTREMALAWAFRAMLFIVTGLAGMVAWLANDKLADINAKLNASGPAIQALSNAQKDTDSGLHQLTQIIKDRTALRDFQYDKIKAEQENQDHVISDHERRIQILEHR